MVIKVTKPVFNINENNPKEISYKDQEGQNWKRVVVQTFAKGFPELGKDDILYKYSENRGWVYNEV